MNELSKGITPKSFFVKLRDGRQINISKLQKENIFLAITDRLQFIEIFDCDTKELLYAGKTNNIEEIIERKFSNNNYVAICSLGERHPIIEGKILCDCIKKMGIFDFDVLASLQMLGYKVYYANDITKEMRQELYKYIKSNSDFNKKLEEYIIKEKEKDALLKIRV